MLTRDKFNAMRMWRLIIFVLIILSVLVGLTWETEPREPKPTINRNTIKTWETWANQLGTELWNLGTFITRRNEVKESFKTAQVVPRDGKKILETMVTEIESMFKSKISAVQRIMDAAENAAMTHDKEKCDEQFSYFDSKEMLEPFAETTTVAPKKFDDRSLDPPNVTIPRIKLTKNRNFYSNPVNTSVSSVHVPTNVYGRACDVIKDIQWSQELDSIFISNYQKDPTLSWQFFGSSTGFMRQFPASKWKQDPVDLFDCRLRSWYIEAAASPKDMVILVDISGSMRGQRKDIAKHVVSNILETLTTNDFVNILKFSERIESVVKCFNDTLVPATLDNIRSLNTGMETIETEKIANYSAALISAFEILQNYRNNDEGAGCNQAIMLISDGVPHDFNDTFRQYNWPNETYRHVRLFTYLIGSEVPDFQLIKEMACINQGYYVHLSVPSEVREQVLRYIPVMARPLVLGRHKHPIIWSHVYADIIDPKMTDYKWEIKQRRKQKDLFLNYRNVQSDGNSTQIDSLRIQQSRNEDDIGEEYNMMTTVSIPVYDRRESAMAIANLLGVAGTDVPIRDIKKLMMPFTLGVNGYAFIVNNNGYILTHPDFRPSFEGILKPAYNIIDMLEVELLDDDSEPRMFSENLLQLVSLDGIHSGVPTRTTATLTPTTLRNIEQTFLELTNDTSNTVPCQAGFVPPLPTFQFEAEPQENSLGSSGSNSSESWHTSPSKQDSSVDENLTEFSSIEKTTSKRNMGGRRPKNSANLSPEEEEKRRVRRERNKLAAARCRKRRVDQTNDLLEKVLVLENDKNKLQREIQDLQAEKEDLECLLQSHRTQCKLHIGSNIGKIDVKTKLEFKEPTHVPLMHATKIKVEVDDSTYDDIPSPTKHLISTANPVISAVTNPTVNSAMLGASKPMTRPNSLNVPFAVQPSQIIASNKNITDIAGIQITTPSNGVVFNFDSLMEGGTGLTPVAMPTCSSQNKSPLDLATPTSESTKSLVSL